MNIISACKLAQKGKTLYSKSRSMSMTTDGDMKGCPVFYSPKEGEDVCPNYEDLLATDWEVVEE
jgi:hypothetical protein